jgi:hypothetical protein
MIVITTRRVDTNRLPDLAGKPELAGKNVAPRLDSVCPNFVFPDRRDEFHPEEYLFEA